MDTFQKATDYAYQVVKTNFPEIKEKPKKILEVVKQILKSD